MKLKLLIIAIITLLILGGCATNPVQEDLINYLNVELPKIADIESKVVDGYASVSGDNYTDDITMYNKIVDEIIDDSKDLIEDAEAIVPKTKEVRELHEIYLKAINNQDSAFTTIIAALETQDYDKISAANDKLSEARRLVREYQATLKELADDFGVILEDIE